MRPAATQFNIYWGNGSHRYEPDFVVETKGHIYLVEIKAEDNLATEEVKAKAKAARQYCALATDYTTKHGGKPWDYILISHSKIKSNSTFEGIRSQSERN
jgi:type III restriction enzyme, res subunit